MSGVNSIHLDGNDDQLGAVQKIDTALGAIGVGPGSGMASERRASLHDSVAAQTRVTELQDTDAALDDLAKTLQRMRGETEQPALLTALDSAIATMFAARKEVASASAVASADAAPSVAPAPAAVQQATRTTAANVVRDITQASQELANTTSRIRERPEVAEQSQPVRDSGSSAPLEALLV
ncbi:MAG: hypothetical protein R2715_24360 [Ilumatobacteraceae bacterium]